MATPIPSPVPVPAVLVPPPAVAPTKGSSVVSDLLASTRLRSDIISALGILGVIVAAFGRQLHIPSVDSGVLLSVSGLVTLGSQVVQTVVHGGVTKVALANDAVFLKEEWPRLKANLEILKPFAAQVPQLKSAIDAASDDAARANSGVSQVQAQVANLPSDQRQQIEDALRGLLASVVPTPAPTPTVTASLPA